MRQIGPNMMLVECGSDLPVMTNVNELFLDFETTAFDPTEKAFHPYRGHRAHGAAVTRDDDPVAYYIPVRHRFLNGTYAPGQVAEEAFARWLRDTVGTCKQWVNHNVKFDAHFAAVEGAMFGGELVDTVIMSQLEDSDRVYRGGYGLDALSAAWLKEDIGPLDNAMQDALKRIKLPRNKKCQDYGLIPIDITAPYACQDVHTARKLYRYLQARQPPELKLTWDIERRLTPVLFDIEHDGMRVDPEELDRQELLTLHRMVTLEGEIESLAGTHYNPASSDDCYALIVNHLGLPVLSLNKDGNPSFDKTALKAYAVHPLVVESPKNVQLIAKVGEYRKLHTYLTLFVNKYKALHVDGVLHPAYKQAVKSFRMSCSTPNAQQLSKLAKRLIHTFNGEAFFASDYSQVEYRLMMHYLENKPAIEAYLANPDTDFHQWVADMCGIPRRPAKNVNFAIGYGAGEKKVTTMLASDITLMGKVVERVDGLIASGQIDPSERKRTFDALCTARAKSVYQQYHDTLPTLVPISRAVARVCRSRGFVFDAYGRRFHVEHEWAHNGFNRLIQGCAASLMKERTVAIAPRYNSITRGLGVKLGWSVHDETGFRGPIDVMKRPEVQAWLVAGLENVKRFSVPIRAGGNYNEHEWPREEDKQEIRRELAAQVGPIPEAV